MAGGSSALCEEGRGGYTPIDPHSLAMADDTDWAWYQTKEFMNRLGSTMTPSEVNPVV